MSDITISEVEPTYYFIYKTTNTITSAFYIGQHYSDTSAFDGYLGSGKYLKRSIKKYGKDNFIREIIEFCDEKTINEREIWWIAQTSACKLIYHDTMGLNLTLGGDGSRGRKGELSPMYGKHHSDEQKKKMSESHKGENNHFYGKTHSESTRNKISNALIGRFTGEKNPNYNKPMSDEQKKKLSDAHKCLQAGEKNPFYGKKHSESTRNKISNALIGRFTGENHPRYGKRHSDNSKKRMSDALKGKYTGENSPSNIYNYTMSNNENYWIYYTPNERSAINHYFRHYKSDTVIYKGIIITRKLK